MLIERGNVAVSIESLRSVGIDGDPGARGPDRDHVTGLCGPQSSLRSIQSVFVVSVVSRDSPIAQPYHGALSSGLRRATGWVWVKQYNQYLVDQLAWPGYNILFLEYL